MTELVKKLLIGASIVVGASTMGAVPTYAASLTEIKFNTDDIEVFGRNGSEGSDVNDAINALIDDDPVTNVELGASSEDQTENIGFEGILGGKEVKVETVTTQEWNNGLKDLWLADFLKVYPELAPWSNLINMATRYGDPNIGGFTFNESNGKYQLDLIGHYDVFKIPYLQPMVRAGLFDGMMAALDGRILQMSEIAKVTIDGEVQYAYGFSAKDTEYVDVDGSSHSGLYRWKTVPEPSTMLGLMAVGGLVTLSQRKSRNKA